MYLHNNEALYWKVSCLQVCKSILLPGSFPSSCLALAYRLYNVGVEMKSTIQTKVEVCHKKQS